MKYTGLDIEKLLEFMVQVYLGRRANLEENKIEEFYSSMINLLNTTFDKNTISKSLYDEFRGVIDRYYGLMQDPKIMQMIKNEDMTKRDFLNQIRFPVLNDSKRIYSMRDLYNRSQFLKGGFTLNNIKYQYKPAEENEYIDRQGNRIRIRKLGQISFIHANNAIENGGIYKYRIQKESPKNRFLEYTVYTKIPVFNMSNPEYKDAVLEELLSTRNIVLSNAEGYIGEILLKPKQENELTENKTTYGYLYRVNDSCVLNYDAAHLTAVISYVNEVNKIMSHDKEKKGEER